ncbi:hypothetical protein ACFQL4_00675 [Halosimplex aquaticum]
MSDDQDRATTQQEFWAGAASGSSRKMLARAQRWLEGPRPSRIMVNYQTMLNGRDSRWRDYDLFIDPGAYSMFAPPENGGQGLAEYPESTELYLQAIGTLQPTCYAWRDYVCEDDVREFHDWSVREQQQRTLEAHIECAELHDILDISAEPVAVVQGWEPEDYQQHAQQLRDHDLVTDRVGIGTMCGRDDVEVCEEIVAAVREVLPDVELHAFGWTSGVTTASSSSARSLRRTRWPTATATSGQRGGPGGSISSSSTWTTAPPGTTPSVVPSISPMRTEIVASPHWRGSRERVRPRLSPLRRSGRRARPLGLERSTTCRRKRGASPARRR